MGEQESPLRPLIRVRDLSKRVGSVDVLSAVSFDILPGEILGIIGPNGAGKTTLLECIGGLTRVNDGTLGASDGSDLRKLVMYVPDGCTPYPELLAADVLQFFAHAYAVPAQEWQRLLRRLNLAPVLGRRVSALSNGALKRLLLAIGLMAPQPVLLLDEPFSGLDLEQTRSFAEFLRQVVGSGRGRGLVLATHELAYAARMCDRLLLLTEGRVMGFGSLDGLRAQAGLSAGADIEDVFLSLTRSHRKELFVALQ